MSTNLHIDYFGNLILRDGKFGLFVSSQYVIPPHYGGGRVGALCLYAVEQVNHYYPYGGLFAESTGGEMQAFKYNGKVLAAKKKIDNLRREDEPLGEGKDRLGLNWYDHGARHNDAAIGRWHCIDPQAASFYDTNPYCYCLNNPANFVDEDGEHPALVGAIVGAAVGATFALFDKNASWESVTGAAIGGAVAGALAGLTLGASLTVTNTLVAGAGANIAGEIIGESVTASLNNKEFTMAADPTKVSAAGLGGVLGAGTGLLLQKGGTVLAEGIRDAGTQIEKISQMSTGSKFLREAAKDMLGGSPNNAQICTQIETLKAASTTSISMQRAGLQFLKQGVDMSVEVNKSIGTNAASLMSEPILNEIDNRIKK